MGTIGVPTQFAKRLAGNRFHGTWCIPVTLANTTATGDLVTDFTPGFAGKIVSWNFQTRNAVTTPDKAVSLNLEISGTNVPGALALTSAACTPLGKVIAGTITGDSGFKSTDTISVEATVSAAFSEGTGTLFIDYEGLTRTADRSTEKFHGSWCFPVMDMTKIADGDFVTDFTPGFAGSLKSMYYIVTTATSTINKLSTLNLEIGTVNVAGGSLALTTANTNAVGKVVNATAITGGNHFDNNDTISIEAASTTAFSQGAGVIVVEYEGKAITGNINPNEFQMRYPNGYFHGSWSFPMLMTDIADGDLVTTFTPGFPGVITKTYWVQNYAVTTADKLSTLNLEIGTTNLTGGAVSLTSAACTPVGKVIAGTAVTAGNRFDADDTISVEAASTTAFIEGDGALIVEYEGKA